MDACAATTDGTRTTARTTAATLADKRIADLLLCSPKRTPKMRAGGDGRFRRAMPGNEWP
jgi:hypothetical protein